jgi:hypothetical protein
VPCSSAFAAAFNFYSMILFCCHNYILTFFRGLPLTLPLSPKGRGNYYYTDAFAEISCIPFSRAL